MALLLPLSGCVWLCGKPNVSLIDKTIVSEASSAAGCGTIVLLFRAPFGYCTS